MNGTFTPEFLLGRPLEKGEHYLLINDDQQATFVIWNGDTWEGQPMFVLDATRSPQGYPGNVNIKCIIPLP